VQRESDKAEHQDDKVHDEKVEAEPQPLTLDHDHRDHLGVDHREGPQDPLESTDHLVGYEKPEVPQEPPEPDDGPEDGDFLRNEVQVPVNAEDADEK